MFFIWLYLLFVVITSSKGHDSTFSEPILSSRSNPELKYSSENICGVNRFYCGNDKCIDQNLVCNGKTDCPSNRDESYQVCMKFGKTLCTENDIGCSDFCYKDRYRMMCGCKDGFKLKDDRNCEDINECDEDGICSQSCINEPGSYRCECAEGFKPDSEKLNRCIVSNESISLFSLTTRRDKTLQFRQDDKILYEIQRGTVAAYDVIISDNIIIWSDLSTNSIYKSQFVYNATPIKIVSNARAHELQVDWVHKNIYWLDNVNGTMEISDLNGNIRKTIIPQSSELQGGKSLRLDPNLGLMFWTRERIFESKTEIHMADMDGSLGFSRILRTYSNIKPEITLDIFEKRIYMMTNDGSEIISHDYNGSRKSIRLIRIPKLSHTKIVAFFEDWIYLHGEEIIYRIQKITNDQPNIARQTFSFPISNLIILHPAYQYQTENQCQVNGKRRCSHLCVPVPFERFGLIELKLKRDFKDYHCVCPEGYQLKSGSVLCVKNGPDSKFPVEDTNISKCDIIGLCSQGCKNNKCTCNDGYGIDPLNSNVCISNNESCSMTFSIQNKLFELNPYDVELKSKHLGSIPYHDLDIKMNLKSNIVFFVNSRGLQRRFINESTTDEIISGNSIIYTVDWIYKHIYYFDPSTSKIKITNFNGENRSILHNGENMDDISIMNLDVKNGLLFYYNRFEYTIFRASMDGSELPKNIINTTSTIASMATDSNLQHLYWVYRFSSKIFYSDYHGRHTKVISLNEKYSLENILTMINMAVYGDWLYLTTDRPSQIIRIDKFHGVNYQLIYPEPRMVIESGGIRNMEIHVESTVINHCESKKGKLCSHLCLPSSNKTILISCACPIGMKLSPDGFNCLSEVASITESSATAHCNANAFLCGSTCIPKSWVCDGEVDCVDGLDEANCRDSPLYPNTCGHDEFFCGIGECIDIKLVCNKINDCRYSSDELNCNYTCDANEFRCDDGTCIKNAFACDKENDCPNGEDENNCHYDTKISCKYDQFLCDSESTCVDNTRKCDGIIDCLDEKDEWNCSGDWKCHHDEFTCKNGECIPSQLHCNDFNECEDGSDELSCSHLNNCNTETQYDCGIGGCVNLADLCNKTLEECPTAENDTRNLCNSTACEISRGGCQHKCEYYPMGYKCSCLEGYEMKDGYNCENINECENDLTCSHICADTPGNYVCSCFPHFQVDPNDRTKCKAVDSHYSLIFNRQHHLQSLNMSSRSLKTIDIDFGSIDAIDYYRPDDTFYWSDIKQQAIFKASASGKTVHRFLPELKITSKGIAVDWMEENLYWTDYVNNSIGMADLKGSMWTALITDEIFKPTIISVDPIGRMLFWVEIGIKPRISRAALDGTRRKVIVENELNRPTGLVCDSIKGRIYWIDEALNSISTCTYSGDKRGVFTELKHDMYDHPRSMTIFNDWIFWVDHDGNYINKFDKLTGEEKETIQINSQISHHLHPMFILTNHSSTQRVTRNMCNTIQSNFTDRGDTCKGSLCTAVNHYPYLICIHGTITGSTESSTSNATTMISICLIILFIIIAAMTILIYWKYFKKSPVVRVVDNPIYYKIEEDNLMIGRTNPMMDEHIETQ